MIIGTAGHIDHGKTSLVKALTGVDTDRLKEEKERGITVDLGFAYQAQPDGAVLGFVDVPGHEKLVRNMLAGATGIDHVMLVVAADDGPMPQTREHLAILDLLGLDRGVVALTKCDLVTPERLAEARAELAALLAGSRLREAPVIAVSSLTGQGLDELRAHLQSARGDRPRTRADGQFRLSVDRSFTLGGVGTVVTGTAVAGRVAVGERLRISPSGREVRVRGLHAHNRAATQGEAGQRLALNVVGVEKAEVRRGDWIVAEALHAPTQRLDVRLQLLAGEARALAHWTPLHLHLGAEDVGARVVLLEAGALQPGRSALVQLELERPIHALHGDRFIVRDQSAQRTLGGGVVLDAFAPPSRRHKAARLAAVAALEQTDPPAALAAALALQGGGGIDALRFGTLWNLDEAARAALLAQVPHRALGDGARTLLFAPGQLERYLQAVQDTLAAHHRRAPDSPGLTQEQLQRAVRDKPAGAVFALLLLQAVRDGTLVRSGAQLALAGHEVTLQGLEKQIWERLKPWLDEGGIHPPKLSDLLLRDRTLRKDQVMRTLQRLQRMGKVHAIGAEYFVQTEHLLQLAVQAQALAERDPHKRLNVRELRDTLGISRHLSVPLVEYFDEIGLTQRDAVGRHFRRDARKMFEG
ncbi:MAG: selenocysteine-specific translation elongation factor [Rubrivivax sp.]